MNTASESHTPTIAPNITPMPPAQPEQSGEQAKESVPPTPEEIARLSEMHSEAAKLNRLTIHTNYQQAIQESLLSPQRKNLQLLVTSFKAWAEGEKALGGN